MTPPASAWPFVARPGLAVIAAVPLAAMHFGGALKSAPVVSAVPFDITILAGAVAIPALALLASGRRWHVSRAVALPIGAAAGLWLWFTIAGLWSGSGAVLSAKLREMVLLGPAMLLAGVVVAGDPRALAAFSRATLAIGVLVGAAVAWGLLVGGVVLGGALDVRPDAVRVQYQITGLAIASAAALAALAAARRAGGPRMLWLGLTACLAAAALLPGGRAGLLGLALAVTLAPAVLFWAQARPRAALGWVALALVGGGAGLAILFLDPERAAGFRTLERFTQGGLDASARPWLWAAALRWAGETLPFGLGTAGFPIAAGFGEWRGRYPHNHVLEAFAEGGLPGLFLWLGCFGGAVVGAVARLPRVTPQRAAMVVALTVPVAVSVLVSTDLGNRMAWLAVGLLIGLGVESTPQQAGPVDV
ncbi:O-antigen ligase family protein [Humitalea sp. 24SJ18S-53]|uniref:O-antigen ligase family protein n=1 Tax=Humitalea sp. 24SJ18S-53 TaxID=3422307 RepID=UPI003D66C31F